MRTSVCQHLHASTAQGSATYEAIKQVEDPTRKQSWQQAVQRMQRPQTGDTEKHSKERMSVSNLRNRTNILMTVRTVDIRRCDCKNEEFQ